MNEIHKKLMEQAQNDESQLAQLIDDYRRESGITMPVLIEILRNIAQEYKFMYTVLKP